MKASGLDWLQVAIVPLCMLSALLSAEFGETTLARILVGAGFALYGTAGLIRGRILVGNTAKLLTGTPARLTGTAFLLAGIIIAFSPS